MKRIVWMIAATAFISVNGMAQVNPFETGTDDGNTSQRIVTPKTLFISPYVSFGWGTAATVMGNGIAERVWYDTKKKAYDIGIDATLNLGKNNRLSFGPHLIQYRSVWDGTSGFSVTDPERRDLALPIVYRTHRSSFKHRSGFAAVVGAMPAFLIDGGGDPYYEYNSFVLSALFGLGYHFSTGMNGGGLTFGIRYHFRITRSGTFHWISKGEDYPMNFSLFTIGLQYDIPVL